MKYILPFLLLVGGATLIVLGGFSLQAPETTESWNPSTFANFRTVLLLLIGTAIAFVGVAVLSTRQRML